MGDRAQGPHEASLQAKYADAAPVEDALSYLEEIAKEKASKST